jgi:hypothetical protein
MKASFTSAVVCRVRPELSSESASALCPPLHLYRADYSASLRVPKTGGLEVSSNFDRILLLFEAEEKIWYLIMAAACSPPCNRVAIAPVQAAVVHNGPVPEAGHRRMPALHLRPLRCSAPEALPRFSPHRRRAEMIVRVRADLQFRLSN